MNAKSSGALILGIRPLGLPEPGVDLKGVGVILLARVPAYLAALLVFHRMARRVAGLRGRTLCGAFGAEMKGGTCGCGASVLGK